MSLESVRKRLEEVNAQRAAFLGPEHWRHWSALEAFSAAKYDLNSHAPTDLELMANVVEAAYDFLVNGRVDGAGQRLKVALDAFEALP